jgi:hypothetical protein
MPNPAAVTASSFLLPIGSDQMPAPCARRIPGASLTDASAAVTTASTALTIANAALTTTNAAMTTASQLTAHQSAIRLTIANAALTTVNAALTTANDLPWNQQVGMLSSLSTAANSQGFSHMQNAAKSRNEPTQTGASSPHASVRTVISGGQRNRNGTPTAPIPRLT